jgi:hypothetical protein
LINLLDKAEKYGKQLWGVCIVYAEGIFPQPQGKIDKAKAKEKSQALPVMKRYWASLEEDFHKLLGEMAAGGNLPDSIAGWHHSIRSALNSAWKPFVASEQIGCARSLRALVKAESRFAGIMKQIKGELEEEAEVSKDANGD